MKQYYIDKNVLIIYINEFCNEQLFCLVNLFIVDEHSQKML